MNRFEHNYDVILYGASIAGVAAALYLSKLGKRVLLVNHYGFPGGAITESMCCLQAVAVENLPEMTGKIFTALMEDAKVNFALANSRYYLDPESVKYKMLQLIAESKCTPLFHVKARAITCTNEPVNSLHLLAKEGTIVVTAPLILDTSDEQYLAKYLRKESKPLEELHLNVVIAGKLPEQFQWTLPPQEKVQLQRERMWASFLLPQQPGAYPDETAQEFLRLLTDNLASAGCSVQVLPVQPYQYEQTEKPVQPSIAGLLSDSSIGTAVPASGNAFARAQAIEHALKQIFENS